MPHPVTILLVEDNPDDEALTVMALRSVPATLEVARDGQEAMDYLTNDGKALPRLVLLDLKLPRIDGLEVLRRIREDDRTRLTPVVVLTSSNAPNDAVSELSPRSQQLCPQARQLRPVLRDNPAARHVLARDQRATAQSPDQ